MRVGRYDVKTILAGLFKLDGGAMFGNVPKVLWSREQPPDESNRIEMTTRVLLLRGEIEGRERVILVDTGCGEKFGEKEVGIFAIDNESRSLAKGLAAHGVRREQVTDVIHTHLHFDHCGGTTQFGADGSIELTFPNAEIWVQRSNWETARAPNLRERASYLPENLDLLESSGRLRLLEGEDPILPGLVPFLSNGHTAGMMGLKVEGESDDAPALYFPADLMPLSSHLKLPYTMGYDLHAAWILEEKERLLGRIRPQHDVVVFEHDPRVGGVLVAPGKRYLDIVETVELDEA